MKGREGKGRRGGKKRKKGKKGKEGKEGREGKGKVRGGTYKEVRRVRLFKEGKTVILFWAMFNSSKDGISFRLDGIAVIRLFCMLLKKESQYSCSGKKIPYK
jgi:hypothetical protein